MSDRHSSAPQWTARIVKSCPHGSQATSLTFSTPTGWAYKAGQYVTIATPAGPRHYSIASSPSRDTAPHITVKSTGAAGRYLCEDIRPRDELDFSGPHGGFVLRDPSRPLLFLGAGSGMVPLASMAIEASYESGPPMIVVGAFADSSSAIALASLRERSGEPHAARPLTVHAWFARANGLPTLENLSGFIGDDVSQAHAYVCGPQGFVDLAKSACESQGVASRAVFTEGYS